MSPPVADRAVLVWARTHGHTQLLDRAVTMFSRFGEHGAGWIVLGLARSASTSEPARRAAFLRGARTVALSYAANQAIKLLVRRRRPELPGLPPLTSTVSQLSFPSAHATTSFAAARVYRGLVPAGALYGTATLLGFSRLYLGVHYPSDVLAGAALGTVIASAARRR
jgi:membrane-associated phospholipid phosphatase